MRKSLLNTAAAVGLLMAASPALAGSWVAIVPVQNSSSTTLFGINDKNVLTGDYVDSSGLQHGFVGPFSGTNYTSFDDSGGTTQARALNDKSYITGFDTGTLIPWERYPNGTIKNVTKGGNELSQVAQGINKAGIFAGNYDNSSGVSIGYLGKKAKYSKKIKLSISNSGYAGRAIDTAGDVSGWYYDSSGVQHGFLIMGGKATSIDYPSAAYTVVEGMNDKGYLSGQYQDSSGNIHGFVYKISTGKFTALDAPGASLTQVWGINNNNVIAASSSAGSFVYCMSKKNCPGTAGAAHTQHPSGRYTPAAP